MRKLCWLILFIIVGALSTVNAQTDRPLYYLGGYAAFNYNIHQTGFGELPGVENCCPEFTGGSGPGVSFGGLFQYPIDDHFFFGLRIGYTSLGAELMREEFIGNTLLIRNGEFREEEAWVDHYLDASLQGIGLEPVAGYYIFKDEGLHLTASLRLDYLFTGTFDQHEELTRPEGATFANGSRIRNEYDGLDIPDFNTLQFFATIGAGYDLPIGTDMYLTPELSYQIPFTNISSVEWKTGGLRIGAAIKAPIYPRRELPVIRDTVVKRDTSVIASRDVRPGVELDSRDVRSEIEETDAAILETVIIDEHYNKYIKEELPLTASVRTVGISPDGERQENPTIVIEENEVSESFPILPYVFFNEGSAELSNTAMHLLKAEETKIFSEDNLSWNTMDIYSEMLNIVGHRMQQNPESEIIITGCNNNTGVETKNLPLSQARAAAVKDYLTYIWGIDPGRILLQKRNQPANPGNTQYPEGQEENQRAEISSNNFEILQPVTLKDIQKTSNPPLVEIYPEINADAGLAGWNLRVMQKDRPIREYTGENQPGVIKWEVEKEPIPELETKVNIDLWAADKDGQTATAADQLELRQLTIRKKRYELKEDMRIERYSLIVFDYDKATLTPNHRRILSQIRDRIEPNSQVTISGYADRTGDSEYNRVLAYRRCMEVQAVLDVPEKNLTVRPVGSDVLLYNNDLPQGRSYSRTVQILIETPIK